MGAALRALHHPSEGAQIVLFSGLNLHHKSPDSGACQHRSRLLKTAVCPGAEGRVLGAVVWARPPLDERKGLRRLAVHNAMTQIVLIGWYQKVNSPLEIVNLLFTITVYYYVSWCVHWFQVEVRPYNCYTPPFAVPNQNQNLVEITCLHPPDLPDSKIQTLNPKT